MFLLYTNMSINSGKRNLSGNNMRYLGGVWPLTIDYDDPVYIVDPEKG